MPKTEDLTLISELKARLAEDIKRHLTSLIFFGSRARGDETEASDLDLIALVDKKTPELEQALEDATYGLMWDNDFKTMISIKVLEETRFREAINRGFSFYRNVEREGLLV